jgi:glycosyltransferase involved in cell wall biosynthesis
MLAVHRAAGSYERQVTLYVALSEFSRRILVEGGLPADRIVVKPNFLTVDPGAGKRDRSRPFVLFVGRLSEEKGLRTLLEAWRRLGPSIPLRIAGTGPLAPMLASPPPGVEWLGQVGAERVRELMRDAALLVFPSEWYEHCPMTLIEAFACGLPSVVSGHGSVAEMVRDTELGLHFRPGDADHLAATVTEGLADPNRLDEMGRAARREYESRYSAEANLPQLISIYERAIRDN